MRNRNPSSLIYTDVKLDRAGIKRKDEEWIASLKNEGLSRIVVVWRNRNLVTESKHGPRALILERKKSIKLANAAEELIFLGLDSNSIPVFAADISHLSEDKAKALVHRHCSLVDLRQLGWLIPRSEASLLAYARGITHWHRTQRYCGYCGTPTKSQEGGHVRLCTNKQCARPNFPRTDPAVIMLIEDPGNSHREPRCLLGRNERWEFPLYSTLAGFVEPGESLEEAVAREVLEEVNVVVEVKNVHYMASQPWPFPSSLMLGFHATASNTDIQVDPDELLDARWFSAKEIMTFKEWDTAVAEEPRLPRRDSIARWLLQNWLDNVTLA
ncbi:MAG: NAD(+) diphosphatase [Magnetovibrio sp.]|nr:NAD(+) diphosphatase [Magnetovibrio sp.]